MTRASVQMDGGSFCCGFPFRLACRLPSPSQSAYASCATSPTGRGKCTPVGGGQAVVRQTCSRLRLTTLFAGIDGGTLGSPRGGTNSDRVQWTKQGAVSGAALRFLQAGTAPRRKKRLSARGAGAKRLRGESPAHNAWNEKNDGNEMPVLRLFRSHRSLSQNRSKRSGGQYTAQLTAPSRTGCCRAWRKSRFGPEARRGCPARRSCRPASPG